MDHQAFAQLLGNYGEFIGSIAVLATLIYLALQIRQTGRSNTFAAIQAYRTERMAWFQGNRDSPHIPRIIAKVEAGQPLDAEEEYRLRMHNAALWGSIFSQWLQDKLALTGRYATKESSMISVGIHSPGALEWWQRYGVSVYPDEFCDYVVKRLPEVATTLPDEPSYPLY